MAKRTLEELQTANLPVATCEAIGLRVRPAQGAPSEAIVEAEAIMRRMNDYLSIFTPISKCPQCEAELGGLLGSFAWGIQTGEGRCTCCGYPVRGQHRTEDFHIFRYLLPYHPSVLKPVGSEEIPDLVKTEDGDG